MTLTVIMRATVCCCVPCRHVLLVCHGAWCGGGLPQSSIPKEPPTAEAACCRGWAPPMLPPLCVWHTCVRVPTRPTGYPPSSTDGPPPAIGRQRPPAEAGRLAHSVCVDVAIDGPSSGLTGYPPSSTDGPCVSWLIQRNRTTRSTAIDMLLQMVGFAPNHCPWASNPQRTPRTP
jgi:hypothetical protein